jgi:hypothetical protein
LQDLLGTPLGDLRQEPRDWLPEGCYKIVLNNNDASRDLERRSCNVCWLTASEVIVPIFKRSNTRRDGDCTR